MVDSRGKTMIRSLGFALSSAAYLAAQTIPNAPQVPTCGWDSSTIPSRSTCRFKPQMTGTSTSIPGNRVIIYERGMFHGVNTPRHLRDAVNRLALRYGFTAQVRTDPSLGAAQLSNTKVVIFNNNAEGTTDSTGRNNLEAFVQQSGWGVIWIHGACGDYT